MEFVTKNGSRPGPIGQGTWYLGENSAAFSQECKALQAGIEQGMTLIDTAEMYGDGRAEELVGRAIRGYDRESLYLVSKVYPFNAGRGKIFNSCRQSLRRLRTDYLDLYLLHWRGSVPLAETVACMEELKQQGLIRAWGVSNLDTADMRELLAVPSGAGCAADQVLYHLGSRGVEYDLLPFLQQQDIPLMAYCPLAQAGRLRQGLLSNDIVRDIAFNCNATPVQVLLAFLLAHPGVMPIPRTGHALHTVENAGAAKLQLTSRDLAALDAAFPPPVRKMPLDMQ